MHRRIPSTLARQVVLALAPALAGSFACEPSPEIEKRAVVVHSPRACAITEDDASSILYAGGDFDTANDRPPTASVSLRDVGRMLDSLPDTTRSLVVDVSDRENEWRGVGEVPAHGSVDVLLWPAHSPCHLTADLERRTDMTLGVFGRHFMVAGGRAIDGSQVPHTYVGDLSTGIVMRLAIGQATRRASASVTAFRVPGDRAGASPALVAGGHDPDSGTGGTPPRPIASAEVYLPKIGAVSDIGDFDGVPIALSEPRTRHGAVVLSTGETLLVGGRGDSGPLRTMEIVDPRTRRARTTGVALMAVAREQPTVLRLANGEILVAGGIDASGNPIPTLEWFSADASHPSKRPAALVTGRERGFVALEAGGALAVVRPAEGAPSDFKTVWVISADGTLEPGVPIPPTDLDSVRLYAGAEGAPALWTGRRWMRWSPWTGEFDAIADTAAPAPGSASGPTLDAIASGDPGLALWLEDRGDALAVNGFRFAARSRFDLVPKSLLVAGTERFAPDRLASAADSSLRFEPEHGLVLGAGASAFITDVTFADVELHLDVTGGAPIVVLRPEGAAELEVGGASCPFGLSALKHLDVTRSGRHVTVSADGDPFLTCPTLLDPNARVAIGLRGALGSDTSAAKNLRVLRQ